jgi:hypothetical protein
MVGTRTGVWFHRYEYMENKEEFELRVMANKGISCTNAYSAFLRVLDPACIAKAKRLDGHTSTLCLLFSALVP